MRNLSNFYSSPGSVEKAARALLKLAKGSNITILTGFCVTEKIVNGECLPVPETDGPPGAIVAGETLRKLSFNVSYVSDSATCAVLRHCLRTVNITGQCVHEFNSEHHPYKQVIEAKRLIDQLQPQAMIAGELCSRNWNDGTRRNMRGINVNHWNPPVDEMLVQFKDQGLIIAVGDGGNEAGMSPLKDKIPLALDGQTVMASDVFSNIPITSWNSNLGLQAVASTVAAMEARFDLIPDGDNVIQMIEASLEAGAIEGITLGKEENSMNGTYTIRGVDGFSPRVHAADQDKLKSTLIQMKSKGIL